MQKFNPGDLVRCNLLSGIYTPMGIVYRAKPGLVYEVYVMHKTGPRLQDFGASCLEIL